MWDSGRDVTTEKGICLSLGSHHSSAEVLSIVTSGSLGSLNFCNLQELSLVSEEVETTLSSAIHTAPFATANTVYLKAHKQSLCMKHRPEVPAAPLTSSRHD